MILDTVSEAPVFHQGGVAISFPGAVRGVISVKATLGKDEVLDSIATLGSAREVAVQAGVDPARMWCGAYFFVASEAVSRQPRHVYSYIEEAIQGAYSASDVVSRMGGPDLVTTATDLAFRLYRQEDSSVSLVGFNCSGLASAIFLAHLLDHLATARGAVRSDFADFADASTIKALDEAAHTFTLR